ncbi:glycyl-tRNA synthetase alpha chain [Monoraphidium neglectum]|uniref:glycine--tRNA ligase n=1 Tax=Monoraphidium neglectum TaxID=145388 RepID=A0A0D2KAK9_9CHLO|nr:glycyl-tRNA synthetase alpha chain [Monoraphidium neglectum]KIZ07293.1 glycyl-tRNA synthetase alpha chain [Monoraphidium neglectum]|eukprot:XP_013906312.1 glycyl-tRNA synthetase alpha chain [Monoraphidium neglectum]
MSPLRQAAAAAPAVAPWAAAASRGFSRRPAAPFASAAPAAAAAAAAEAASPAAPVVAEPVAANGAGNGQAAATAPTFQDAIRRLQDYWASRGCVVWMPHNTEVGAGTMNPATFLRVLGPEPWNVAYPEPSVRPDDSRYGDNPNRVQRHTQFQVILKPDPGNAQELYLGSLEALGIDTRKHDIRFVEDNWESPVLGAWGLGWEVWLDGMEVTQFTYFQQAGGKVLDAPAVEITYGMERILMARQGAKHFKDIKYNDAVTYGELFLQNEYEMSCYNLDEADVAEQVFGGGHGDVTAVAIQADGQAAWRASWEGLRQRFALFDAEARRLLAKRLPVPAYDHLLKLSHTFNVLDARGAVGVTERADCFATMRALAREVTALWLERREEQGYPLGQVAPPEALTPGKPAPPPSGAPPRAFVLEIGSEELPPDDVLSGIAQLRERIPALLQRLRLAHESVTVHGTPRRLAVLVSGLAARQEPIESRVRGPPAKAAFDAAGKPTKALEGFCKKAGADPSSVAVEADAKGVEYCWVVVKDAGRSAAEVLTDELPALVGSISFKKSMRWRGDTAYSRPMRWLLALHGDTPLPFVYGPILAGAATRVLRNAAQPEQRVGSAEEYEQLLARERITLDLERRRQDIWAATVAAAAEVGGVVPESSRGDLLDEVANLVESPTPVRGAFDAAFLALPE